jgi:hypothetical protein
MSIRPCAGIAFLNICLFPCVHATTRLLLRGPVIPRSVLFGRFEKDLELRCVYRLICLP